MVIYGFFVVIWREYCIKKRLLEDFFLFQFIVLEKLGELDLELLEKMMKTHDDLFQMLWIGLIGSYVTSFGLELTFSKSFWGDFKLINLIWTHFKGSFSLLIELVSLLVCEWGETICGIWEVIVFLVPEDLVNFAQGQVDAFSIFEWELVL